MKVADASRHLRHITLESQGLTKPAPFGKGKAAVLRAMEHLGYIQIDTLSIVERAHHHTLWTRIPDYKTEYLDQLIAERKVFEYWFHAASYLPVRDFRFALPQMMRFKRGPSPYYNADPKVMQYVMDTIRTEGPKKARDFENRKKRSGSWWSWKPTKLALERLFMQGDLMISGRDGMQKTYDLRERVLPETMHATEPTPMEWAEYLVRTYLRAYGFTTIKQITHLKTDERLRKNVQDILQSMLTADAVQRVDIKGSPSVFILSEWAEKPFKKNGPSIRLLSPFDNAIIHRDRVKHVFDFDFRIECYTPQKKRQYGYFCLPVLWGDTFIGRVDCKAHRKDQRLELIHLHIENTAPSFEIWAEAFIKSVRRFAAFNGCSAIVLTKVSPSRYKKALTTLLKNKNTGAHAV